MAKSTKRRIKKKEWISIDDVTCPVCDNQINKLWFEGMNRQLAFFCADCWSGDIYENMPSHIFRFHIALPEIKTYGDIINEE